MGNLSQSLEGPRANAPVRDGCLIYVARKQRSSVTVATETCGTGNAAGVFDPTGAAERASSLGVVRCK